MVFLDFFAETGRAAAHTKSTDDVRVCAVSVCTFGVGVVGTKLVHFFIGVTFVLAWPADGSFGDSILGDGRCWRLHLRLESLGLECLGLACCCSS